MTKADIARDYRRKYGKQMPTLKLARILYDYGKKNKVNTIFINGDLIDNHQISRFEKDPNKRSIKQLKINLCLYT